MRLHKQIIGLMVALSVLAFGLPAFAATPTGADTFQFLASPSTGGDNTGDGGTGAVSDLNYYYVGQSFSTVMQITSTGTTTANIWIDYNSALAAASSLLTGVYFNIWSGQTINATQTGPTGGRVFSTGAEVPVAVRSGTGTFGSVRWSALQPTATNYGTGAPVTLDINTGVIGATTESNISLAGLDILDDAEDFQFHIWADTNKPFAENPSPTNGTVGVAVDASYGFDLRDTKNGEGDNTGVGTGISTSTPPGAITFNDGTGAVSVTSYDAYSCSGVWGTNLCSVSINPPSPSGISGDARNWEYGATYTVTISGFKDLASTNQDHLGDTNGPNIMNEKSYTFTTEGDTVAPQVVSISPGRGSSNASIASNITIGIDDRKNYPSGVSGVGVGDPGLCAITVSSLTIGTITYHQGDPGLTVTSTNYGYQFAMNPADDFAQNETVSVAVSDCEDLVGNVMTPDSWTFTTTDATPPYVDEELPANDATILPSGTLSFHLKDDGVGVDFASTVVYVNGIHYTFTGGAGSVTTSGTHITFADSLNFNGANYAGDTTGIVGTQTDSRITIDPESDFADNEAIPVIVYAKDLNGNIMERVVYALYTGVGSSSSGSSGGGGSCTEGTAYCGNNTSWNGSQCVALTTGGGGGGAYHPRLEINATNLVVSQIDEQSVLVSWYSTLQGSARVIYDTKTLSSTIGTPNYGWRFSTDTFADNSVYHAVVVGGLTPGTLYFFRPVTATNGEEVVGSEVQMVPRFKTEVVEHFVRGQTTLTCATPLVPAVLYSAPTIPVTQPTVPIAPSVHPLKITDLKFIEGGIGVTGIAQPNARVSVEVF